MKDGAIAEGCDKRLGESVSFAEYAAAEMHDVLGVRVVLGEDKRLEREHGTGELFGLNNVAIGAQDGADLIGHDNGQSICTRAFCSEVIPIFHPSAAEFGES